MANMLQLLNGALRGGQKNPAGNDGSNRAKAEQAHQQALEHYGQVLRSTNDKGQIEQAHKALLDATAAMGAAK